MRKIKISIPDEDFGTLNTKYPADSNRVSNDDFTAGTKNIETSVKGVITKRKGGVKYTELPTPPRDQYEAIFSDGVRHLLTVDNGVLRYSSGDGTNTQVLSGLSAALNFEFATTQDRIYFGNGISKKVYDRVTNYGGVPYTFPTGTVKDMGAQVPATAPTITSQQAASSGGVPIGNHRYKVTYVYYDSEESNGSVTSTTAVVTGGTNNEITLGIPAGGYGVTQRKIYRDFNANNQYLLVGVLNNNTAVSFSDSNPAGLTPIPEDQGTPPDFTLASLYLDRLFLAGISGDPYSLFFSDVGMPDIYPGFNVLTCNQEDPITGTVVYLDRLIVFNRRSMGQILGKTSDEFRYADIQGSIGCVDSRSIQIRVLNGVPVLVWLSDKGFYAYNGNSIVYISDAIEDQINTNIQQSVIQRNRISHSDYSTFTSGTSSDGINLEASQGSITTKGPRWDGALHPLATYEDKTNPKYEWNTRGAFEVAGAQKDNIATKQDIPSIEVIKNNRFDSATGLVGTLQGDIIYTAGKLKLPVTPDFSGLSDLSGGPAPSSTWGDYAQSTFLARKGKITSITVRVVGFTGARFRIKVWGDLSGNPSGNLYTSSEFSCPSGTTTQNYQVTGLNVDVTSDNTRVWIGIIRTNPIFLTNQFPYLTGDVTNTVFIGESAKAFSGGSWVLAKAEGIILRHFSVAYTFSQTALRKSGSWVSPIYDSKSIYTDQGTFSANTVIPTNFGDKTTSIQLLTSGTGLDGSFTQASELSAAPFSEAVSLGGKRYFRSIVSLSTTDDRETHEVNNIRADVPAAAEWISEPVDCTADVVSYNPLQVTSIVPSGTSLTITAASSDDNITYGSYQAIGSTPVKRWVKLRVQMTRSGDATTPSLRFLGFSWNLKAEFVSPPVDTAVTPSGWEIFQTSVEPNGGTVSYFMRSAASSGALSSATWYPVTNGQFPENVPSLQWAQWKAEIESSPDQVPVISSTTIGWLIGEAGEGIRCASLFYDKNYYVSLAEFENDRNNVMFVLDSENKWRVFRGISAATMSYFFNNPYYGDGASGHIVKFLEGLSDQGQPIELDVRTKAHTGSTEFVDTEGQIKVLQQVLFNCSNTGATYTCSYSVDEGQTFNLLYDKEGNSTWTTLTDGKEIYKYLRPRFTTSIPHGRTVMFKVYNNDVKEVQIRSIKSEMLVRKQLPMD